uniref:Uncharacterized protein n=1 Tax=Pfiesteria piscicida TaxID=71001 RepID=A3E3Q1_PFIPI|nr:unknown [Pfiesteria piscicida]
MCSCLNHNMVGALCSSVLALSVVHVVAQQFAGQQPNESAETDDEGYDVLNGIPMKLEAWGVTSGRFPNTSFPSGTSISCFGTHFFAHEVSLGFPVSDRCVVINNHISDFEGGCSSDDVFSPAHATNRTRIGRLGPADVEQDLRLLLLDPPRMVPFYFHTTLACSVMQEPLRMRKHGALTGATDVRVGFAFIALNAHFYTATGRKYKIARSWFVNAPGLATPDDSGAFVEGLVKINGTKTWCPMGMLLGGGSADRSFVVVLPIESVQKFAASHAALCLQKYASAEL